MKNGMIKDILKVINMVEDFKIEESQLNESLLEYGVDSVAFIKIIVALEEKFDCEIPDEKLLLTELDTVQKISDVLYQLKNE